MKFFDVIKGMFIKKKPLPFPIPSALITLTPEGLDEGLTDDPNKQILLYELNYFGNIVEKKLRYSESQIKILRDKKIPIKDKTKGEDRFPLYSKIEPSESKYTSKW